MKTEHHALRVLLIDLSAGRMPPAATIATAAALVAAADKARAEMKEALKPPSKEELHADFASGKAHLALTEPQWRELKAIASEPQNTYGKARAAVQNRLVAMTLAAFMEDGRRCAITEAGQVILAANTAPDGRFRSDHPGAAR